MDYLIYTDGSVKRDIKKAGIAYVITSGDRCLKIGYQTVKYENILNVECEAINTALTWLLKRKGLQKGDKVKLFTDNNYARDLYKCLEQFKPIDKQVHHYFYRYIFPVARMAKLGVKFKIEKVHAHTGGFTTNDCCDRLAKLSMCYDFPCDADFSGSRYEPTVVKF